MRQTQINFTDQYEDGHVAVVGYPETLHFADSGRCTVEVSVADSENAPDYNVQVLMTVKESTATQGYTELRVTDRDGRASFDVARYVQMILGDIDADGVFDYSQNSKLVEQKSVTVSLTVMGVAVFTGTFNAVHGNDRIEDRWWSKERRLRWWTAYPFAFDFVNTDEVTVRNISGVSSVVPFPEVSTTLSNTRVRVKPSVFGNGSMTVSKALTGLSFGIASASDTGHIPGTKIFRAATNTVRIEAEGCAADPNAAYLRWLDRHCELRHWLFSKHSESDTVKAEFDTRSGFDPDRFVGGVARDGRMRDGILTKELTVNTGYLQGWEYDIVESIVNAPWVDMLDMEAYIADGTILWHRVMVKPGSYTKALRNSHANDHNLQLAVTLQYDGERSVGV